MKLIFASNNKHKLEEAQAILGNLVEIVSLSDIGCNEDIPETADTLEGNALQKAHYVLNKFAYPCFADDTGLEIDALNGRPGVYSARYAGENCNFDDNMNKVLKELENTSNRQARFRTVIALLLDGKEYLFEGSVEGEILKVKKGVKGFGYDPIFKPSGFDTSFAEMSSESKNTISHRALAMQKLLAFLRSYHT
ncbi:MAG: non-canonical purine NTP diphosphatase [Bacteroidales bacterium]|nr:non-canonical purine NTP diphosphatase [Bacteroidales bacterium]MDD4209546.1 non-canonical purine NTP diphosphatase [Bacteroidales bacterium]